MALINCKECNAEVSDKAKTCPKCGTTLRVPKRGVVGKIIKYSFIAFNLLMLWWMIAGVGGAAETIDASASEAEQAGAAIGTGLGAMMIMVIWVFGDIVLGLLVLFTRPK
ncbi:zinc ribbon domain-containing protein [Aureispira sp. CCB-QB1]|uniref:zinc ribbon domain-containing protein n=1 Tax=Aureispira sp. CCB-QB1 TaxID=1313421 RepID=UPI000696EDFA|nr:zinc ribbon domain-containing protein [Aureispira sp. CCB-QB1]